MINGDSETRRPRQVKESNEDCGCENQPPAGLRQSLSENGEQSFGGSFDGCLSRSKFHFVQSLRFSYFRTQLKEGDMTSVDIPLKTFLKKRSNSDNDVNALALNDF